MNITKEDNGELTAMLKVEIQEEDYKDAVDKKLNEYRKKAQMPGFRQGKVPMGIIRKKYGTSVIFDEINNLISSELEKYISENEINLLGNPLPSKDKSPKFDVENDTNFEFYFDVAFQPEINLTVDENIEVDYYNIEVDEKLVDNYLEDIRKKYGKQINPDTVGENDAVYADFKQLDDDKNIIEGGVENNAPFSVDKIQQKTYKENIIGSRVGDTMDLNPMRTFKDETDVAQMLEIDKSEEDKLKSDYRCTITDISQIEPAPLDEDLFSQVYENDNIKTEEELRERIRKDTAESLANESEKLFFNDVAEELKRLMDIKLPDEFMKRWLKENNRNAEEKDQLAEEDIDENYEQYTEGMKWQLLRNKLLNDHDINVTQDEVKDRVRELLSMQMRMQSDELQEHMDQLVDTVMQNEKETNRIYDELYEKKLNDLFKEKITINEKNISYDEFVNLAREKKQ